MITVKSTRSVATSSSPPPLRKGTLGRCAIGAGALVAAATLWVVAKAPSSAETQDSVAAGPAISAADIIVMNLGAADPAAAESKFYLVDDYGVGWGYVEFESPPSATTRTSVKPTTAE